MGQLPMRRDKFKMLIKREICEQECLTSVTSAKAGQYLSRTRHPKAFSKLGFPGGSVVKNLPANAEDVGSISGSGRSPGRGHGNPLQYSCLGNPMDRGAWWATVYGSQRVGHNLVTEQQQQQPFGWVF